MSGPACGNCGECDVCTAYDPPWGWDVARFDAYVINTIVAFARADVATGRERSPDANPGHAWCVLVILLSTAAMALTSEPATEAA